MGIFPIIRATKNITLKMCFKRINLGIAMNKLLKMSKIYDKKRKKKVIY